MDKSVILAVAGSGKTTHIVRSLLSDRRSLVITYTENNLRNLRTKVIQKFGHLPSNVTLLSYFTFLYSFCFKPFLWRACRATGINWKIPPRWTLKMRRDNPQFYFDTHRRIYHNRIAKLLETKGVVHMLRQRLEKYFDTLFIDEVQDFAGHDFNLLLKIIPCRLNIQLVGDFYQHTFDTSRDGNVNKNIHKDLNVYIGLLLKAGLSEDRESLRKSYRCSSTLCEYVSENLDIEMESHCNEETKIEWVSRIDEAKRIRDSNEIIKLFYRTHYEYQCYSNNWGASKGSEYTDVAVVLNKSSYRKLEKGCAHELAPQTKNKLYVACTRARNTVYFISEELIRNCRKKER